jgi:hypothetical protein
MERADFHECIGTDNLLPDVKSAIARARQLLELRRLQGSRTLAPKVG